MSLYKLVQKVMGLKILFRSLKCHALYTLTWFIRLYAINATMLSFLSCSFTHTTLHMLYGTYKILLAAKNPRFCIITEYCEKCKQA